MSDLRSARRRLGLTQVRVAELFGTSAANISAYEHERLLPGPTVLARIEALASISASSAYVAQPLMTAASTSASLRRAVRADDPAGALRLLAQSLADLRRVVDDPGGRGLYLVAPGGTGSKEWNALLAGAVARECRLVGIDPPRWTRVQPLLHGWSPITLPGLRDYLVERTPPELARLSVWLDEGSLGAA